MDVRASWNASLLMVLTIFLSVRSLTLARPESTVVSDWNVDNDTDIEFEVVRAYQFGPPPFGPPIGRPGIPPTGPFGPGIGPGLGPYGPGIGPYGPGRDPCRVDPLACARDPYLRLLNHGQSLHSSLMLLLSAVLAILFS